MSATLTERLYEVKAGDKVVLREGFVHCNRIVVEVKRVTDKRIIVSTKYNNGEIIFRKDGGREIGGSKYTPRQILPATDELLAEVEFEHKRKVLEDFRFSIPREKKQLIENVYDFLKSKDLIK